jgi:hypothetical protein
MRPMLDSSAGLPTTLARPRAACACRTRSKIWDPGPLGEANPAEGPNGTPGKKPPAPSVKIRPGDFHTLVEILKGRKPR